MHSSLFFSKITNEKNHGASYGPGNTVNLTHAFYIPFHRILFDLNDKSRTPGRRDDWILYGGA